jgi:hypothetical protein
VTAALDGRNDALRDLSRFRDLSTQNLHLADFSGSGRA